MEANIHPRFLAACLFFHRADCLNRGPFGPVGSNPRPNLRATVLPDDRSDAHVGLQPLEVGVTNMNQMFASCASLEIIWAEGFTSSSTSNSLVSSGHVRLADGRGHAPEADG